MIICDKCKKELKFGTEYELTVDDATCDNYPAFRAHLCSTCYVGFRDFLNDDPNADVTQEVETNPVPANIDWN